MFLIPLNQLESVELVIHCLKMAGGAADCSSCPAYKVCMKQCLTIAGAIEEMLRQESLPQLNPPQSAEQAEPREEPSGDNTAGGRARLTLIK